MVLEQLDLFRGENLTFILIYNTYKNKSKEIIGLNIKTNSIEFLNKVYKRKCLCNPVRKSTKAHIIKENFY